MRCPRCRSENAEEAKFCANCGAALAPREALPEVRASYTPAYLTDELFAAHAVIEGERKLVTVLFCDIAGSTALAHRIGAEAMHRLLKRFFDAALEEVHRYEGTLNQFLGDGFMALFGAPIAHENHARRAVHAALAIRRRCHAQAPNPAERRVPLRFGLNTGAVVVGKLGDNLRMDYTAVGDTTNLAARMQQLAAPGEILLAAQTWEAVQHHFECVALGERRLKGHEEGVPVYRLVDVRSTQAPGAYSATSPVAAPIVGRAAELSRLRACIARLRSGEGGIVGVIGEAGVGKSRLLQEARRAEQTGLRWLEGHALSFGRNLSYSPFMEALRSVAGIDEREGREASWAKLEPYLRELLATEAVALLPFAGMLMGLELPALATALVARLDPQDVRGQIFLVARRIFEGLTRGGPVVLELEDWHWADESSAGLLEHLLPLAETEALLVCFAGRAEAGSACDRAREFASPRYPRCYVELLLEPLSSSDSNHLIDDLAGDRGLRPALRDMILRKAEGNPLFIEEVVRSLQGAGALRRLPGSAALRAGAGEAEDIDLPDSVEAIVTARIDRLQADVKQVVRLAAVIGRSFYQRILKALDEAEHQLDQCLDQLQQFDLIRMRRTAPEIEYIFKHALVHEAAYHSILEERRRELHRRVAGAIETLFAERLDELAGLLAYHYARAAEWSKAHRYLLRAGDQASRMSSDAEALAHYRSALESYGRAFGERWDRFERASLERKIGEALFRLGRHDEASRHLHTALALLGNRSPRTHAGVLLHILGHVFQQIWHQIRPHRRWQRGDPIVTDDTDRFRAWLTLGWLDYFRDEERFLLDVLVGLNWAERRGTATMAAQGLMGLGIACDIMRLLPLAGFYHRRALSVAAQQDDPVASATAEFGMAMHRMMVGEWDSAVAGMGHASEAFGSQGKLREHAVSSTSLVWLLLQRGDIAQAQQITDDLAHRADDAGDVQGSLQWIGLRGLILMQQGHLAEAAASMERGIDDAKGIPDYMMLCEFLGDRAICALWMGDLPRAERSIDEARRLMHERSIVPHLTSTPRAANGWFALTLLEQSPAPERASAERRVAKAVRVLHRLDRVYAGAVPIAHCVNGSLLWLQGRRSRAEAAWKRSLETAENLGAAYQLAITRQEMGRLTRERPHLDTAFDFFDGAGFAFQAARTLRYLGEICARDDPCAAAEYLRRSLARHEVMSTSYERQLAEEQLRAVQGK